MRQRASSALPIIPTSRRTTYFFVICPFNLWVRWTTFLDETCVAYGRVAMNDDNSDMDRKRKTRERERNITRRNRNDERFEFWNGLGWYSVDIRLFLISSWLCIKTLRCVSTLPHAPFTTSLIKVDLRNYVQINDLENCGWWMQTCERFVCVVDDTSPFSLETAAATASHI